jgi:hypothetical protein
MELNYHTVIIFYNELFYIITLYYFSWQYLITNIIHDFFQIINKIDLV